MGENQGQRDFSMPHEEVSYLQPRCADGKLEFLHRDGIYTMVSVTRGILSNECLRISL